MYSPWLDPIPEAIHKSYHTFCGSIKLFSEIPYIFSDKLIQELLLYLFNSHRTDSDYLGDVADAYTLLQ